MKKAVVVGMGRVGSALAHSLYSTRDIELIGVISSKRIPPCLNEVGIGVVDWKMVADSDVIFVAVRDDVLKNVSERISEYVSAGAFVCHTSGVYSESVLGCCKDCGAYVGVFHPIKPFVDFCESLNGVFWGISGDECVKEFLSDLIDRWGGKAIEVHSDRHALYHSALFLMCGLAGVLPSVGEKILIDAGLSEEDARNVSRDLFLRCAEVFSRKGKLSGPMHRGDRETLRLHREALANWAPEIEELYSKLLKFSEEFG